MMMDSHQEEDDKPTSTDKNTEEETAQENNNNNNDPWANDGSILPDMGCQYQLLSQPPETYDDNDDDDDDDDDEIISNEDDDQHQPDDEESNAVPSLDIADSLLRGLEEDYRATHTRTFAASRPAEPAVELKEPSSTEDEVGESSVDDNETNRNESSEEKNNNGNPLFPVHWNDDSKPDVEVDLAAVRKTIQGISDDKTSKFMQKYSTWQQRQQESHPIIPSAPYKAFVRETDKAKRATASLSRSATIAESIWRCQQQNLLLHHSATSSSNNNNHKNTTLIVDVVGVDHVECASVSRIQETFRPIVRWLGAWDGLPSSSIDTVELRLIGRDLSKSVSAEPIDLMTPSNNIKSNCTHLTKATAICFSEICYHDWRATVERNPDLIVAFNAGIWGYVEWAPTLRALSQGSTPTPTVITSYTLEESQEDCESIEEAVAPGTISSTAGSKRLWGPEPNPFGSKMIRETKSSSREYRENSAWQMWLLGGAADTALL